MFKFLWEQCGKIAIGGLVVAATLGTVICVLPLSTALLAGAVGGAITIGVLGGFAAGIYVTQTYTKQQQAEQDKLNQLQRDNDSLAEDMKNAVPTVTLNSINNQIASLGKEILAEIKTNEKKAELHRSQQATEQKSNEKTYLALFRQAADRTAWSQPSNAANDSAMPALSVSDIPVRGPKR